MPIERLTPARLAGAVRVLCRRDPDLAAVVTRVGLPPLWARPPGFATLIRILFEQQVSLASGAATYRRLQDALGRVTPSRVAAWPVPRLRRLGITRQKAEYCANLARLVVEKRLSLSILDELPDETVREILCDVRGIGRWTADVYLLMALRRPDVWPPGDLALVEAARQVKGLRQRPSPEQLEGLAVAWRPWRAVAARILWSHYLSVRRKRSSPRVASA